MSLPKSLDAYLTFKSIGSDPYVSSPNSLKIDASLTPVVTVRMRVTQSQGSFGSILFLTNKDSNWGGTKYVSFPITNDGAFHTYNILMSENTAWQGMITQLRLDPVEDGTANEQFAIDYISVHEP